MTRPERMNQADPAPAGVLAFALHAAGRGWPVFPLRAGDKTPAIRAAHEAGHPCRGECGRLGHGFHDATTDPHLIEGWWRSRPAANYGISTGPADLVVIDLDTAKSLRPDRVLPDQGESEATPAGILDGDDVLTWAAERAGAAIGWGDTLTVSTPSGGAHLYYALPAGVVVRSSRGHSAGRITGLGWCIDVRAVGGYVAGPGSRVRGGKSPADGYAAIIKGAVAPLPGWLLDLLTAIGSVGDTPPCITETVAVRPGPAAGAPTSTGYGRAALTGELAHIAAADPGDKGGGGRNDTVNRAAFKLGRILDTAGLDADQVSAQLLAAAMAVGLPEREARRAIASGLARGRATYRTPTTGPALSGGKR